MTAVRIRHLSKKFGEVVALTDLSLDVRESEVLGLLGPNGAGKTTTLRILATLIRPDGGDAEVAGANVLSNPADVRRRIGYVPQEVTADKQLTAREQLGLFADLYHLPRELKRRRIDELLALVGLEGVADRVSRGYSGGMKKKLDLACGLIHEPRVLFLDEPSLGLDVQIRRAIWEYIKILRSRGVTVILSTNSMDEADRLCDRVAIIDCGRIVALGTPAALREELGGDVVTVTPGDGGTEEGGSGEGDAAADRLEQAVSSLPFVRGMTREGRRLHVYVASNETALPSLLETASACGVTIHSVSYSRPGLDEVFLRHTGRAFGAPPRLEIAPGAAGPKSHR